MLVWKGKERTLVEGSDFVIRTVDFGTGKVDGAVMPSNDGIECIYINSRVCKSRQQSALRHELQHILNDDLYNDIDDIATIERRNPF